MINEKDIDEFLRFRNKFTALEWNTINNYVEIVLEDRKRNFVLSESELKHVRNLIKKDKFIQLRFEYGKFIQKIIKTAIHKQSFTYQFSAYTLGGYYVFISFWKQQGQTHNHNKLVKQCFRLLRFSQV